MANLYSTCGYHVCQNFLAISRPRKRFCYKPKIYPETSFIVAGIILECSWPRHTHILNQSHDSVIAGSFPFTATQNTEFPIRNIWHAQSVCIHLLVCWSFLSYSTFYCVAGGAATSFHPKMFLNYMWPNFTNKLKKSMLYRNTVTL
jgi:hypothetical protein